MRQSTHHRRGFTLIEVLIAVGIIVLLTALAIPAILHSRQKAIVIRIRSDLALIDTALKAYNADFNDYPRFDDDSSTDSLNVQHDRGARLLCRALLGPAQARLTGGATFGFVAPEQAPDGADGPGFRVRAGNGGKVWGPYIDAGKFKLGNTGAGANWDQQYFTDATLLDLHGNSILYYPGLTTASPGTAYVQAVPAGGTAHPMYNGYDNSNYGSSTTTKYLLPVQHLAFILGDRQALGYLGAGEKASTTAPYLLWSAGADGQYGFGVDGSGAPNVWTQGMKTDDITNFDMPSDLQK